MDKKLGVGTVTFALLSIVLGLAVQVLIDLAGAETALAGQIGTFLISVPLALLGARRVGRVTRLSVLVVSAALALATLWAIVFMLNSVPTEPAGGHAGWSTLFNAMNWRNTIFGSAAMLLAPQAWLSVLNRLAANNSFKPKPLRGSA